MSKNHDLMSINYYLTDIDRFLPKFINKIVRYLYLISGSDFKTFLLFNISVFYNKFLSLRVNLSTAASADLTEDNSFYIE